jgi:Ser/Thr protein kinase RdoA (MazF antagonist)
MGERRGELSYLEAMAERVRPVLAASPRRSPAYGFCHGDLHPGNVCFDGDGRPTPFDFDSCGYGWRIYDLTVFLRNAYGEGCPRAWRDARWRAFLRRYRERRALEPAVMEALPHFLVARQIWLLGLDCAGRSEWLPQWRTADWFSGMVGTIHGWEAEFPDLGGPSGAGPG